MICVGDIVCIPRFQRYQDRLLLGNTRVCQGTVKNVREHQVTAWNNSEPYGLLQIGNNSENKEYQGILMNTRSFYGILKNAKGILGNTQKHQGTLVKTTQEHFESGQIHAPLISQGSVGTDQEILERHQLIHLSKSAGLGAASFAL